MEPKEKDIERAIIKYLRTNNIYCEKQESGVAFVESEHGEPYAIRLQRDGTPDIIACVPIVITPDMVGKTIGVFHGIEVKKGDKEKKSWLKYDHNDVFKTKGVNKTIEMQKVRRDQILSSGGRFILPSALSEVYPLVQDAI